MVAASIILYIGTILAMLWFGWRLTQGMDEVVAIIHDTVETEVRKQDERLEKRRQRAQDPLPDTDETEDGQRPTVRAGRSMR